MALIVQKFGGTSVGSPQRIRAVADRIARTYHQGHQLVVVVSAMGHTTDELIELAYQVSDHPPHREMDMLLTAGERISMALLCMALADRKIPAMSFTGSQTGIITDQSHRRARVKKILGDRIRSAIASQKVSIIAGFQGVSETKEITTLGRGGSDTSAVALAAALKAEVCEIYTDVDGVYSADPRHVPTARLWKNIPHDLMVELATRGAGVLHPRCVELAKQFHVPLIVRSSLNDSEGTKVISNTSDGQKSDGQKRSSRSEGMEEFDIVGVTSDDSKVLVTIELKRPSVIASIWDRASQSHLPIITPVFMGKQVSFFTDRDGEGEWKKHLEDLCCQGFVDSYKIDTEIVPLSVVGHRFSQDGKALQSILETLSTENIPTCLGSGSSLAITVGVPLSKASDGVALLHRVFIDEITVSGSKGEKQ